jgi:hypothetical protein
VSFVQTQALLPFIYRPPHPQDVVGQDAVDEAV